VSELRSLKAAAMMYYADYNEWPAVDGDAETFNSALAKYMDRDEPATGEYAEYRIVSDDFKYLEQDEGASADSGIWVEADVTKAGGTVSDILRGEKGVEAGLATDDTNNNKFYMILESK
jgi:hypothetical protein